MQKQLEIACFDEQSARIAAKAGAHRIEFCAGLSSGGTTPSLAETGALLKEIRIPVFVMIRPRGGDFMYTTDEIDTMKKQITEFKNLGVHGFVFGLLDNRHQIDEKACSELVERAGNLPCTFHRAFDHTPALDQSLEKLITLGFKRVLTSGGKGNAPDNVEVLTQLVKQAGNRIGILPGGGVRSSNLKDLLKTGAAGFHSSGIVPATHPYADASEIKKILDALV